MTSSSRRDDLHTVYMFVVKNWAVDRMEIETHTGISRESR